MISPRSLALTVLVFATLGCAGSERPAPAPAPKPDSSETSLDWDGTYRGVVPCADCEGIETELTLSRDRTYVLSTRYLGKNFPSRELRGTFAWNDAGNAVTLSNVPGGPTQYRVGENALIQLDLNGQPITGPLAPNYRLEKVTAATEPDIAGVRWRLVELMGKPVPAAADPERAPFLRLIEDGQRIEGFGGCNTFGGRYELPAPTRIRFSHVAATLMACPDMQVETEFLRVLESTDNYAIAEDRLSLHKARMAPLARFERAPAP